MENNTNSNKKNQAIDNLNKAANVGIGVAVTAGEEIQKGVKVVAKEISKATDKVKSGSQKGFVVTKEKLKAAFAKMQEKGELSRENVSSSLSGVADKVVVVSKDAFDGLVGFAKKKGYEEDVEKAEFDVEDPIVDEENIEVQSEDAIG